MIVSCRKCCFCSVIFTLRKISYLSRASNKKNTLTNYRISLRRLHRFLVAKYNKNKFKVQGYYRGCGSWLYYVVYSLIFFIKWSFIIITRLYFRRKIINWWKGSLSNPIWSERIKTTKVYSFLRLFSVWDVVSVFWFDKRTSGYNFMSERYVFLFLKFLFKQMRDNFIICALWLMILTCGYLVCQALYPWIFLKPTGNNIISLKRLIIRA